MGGLNPIAVYIVVLGIRLIRASELCLKGDFDQQFSYVLRNEMLTEDQIRDMSKVFSEVEAALNSRWPGTTITPYGSLVMGLGLKASDVDCLALVPGYWNTESYNLSSYVFETAKMFMQQPTIYRKPFIKINRGVYLLTFFHTPTQVNCDLSFTSIKEVNLSELINYYMFLDDRLRKDTVFLKFWAKIHQLAGQHLVPTYGIAVLAIFYFQQRKIVPPIYLLQIDVDPNYEGEWNTAFNRIPFKTLNNESLYELLHGFLNYYSNFNFDDYIVSVYAGRPILKSDFKDIGRVPEEFALYKRKLREGTIKLPKFHVNFWIQDMTNHDISITDDKGPRMSWALFYYIRYAAKMFNELPPVDVLRAMLVKDSIHDNRLLQSAEIDSVSGSKYCDYIQ